MSQNFNIMSLNTGGISKKMIKYESVIAKSISPLSKVNVFVENVSLKIGLICRKNT